MKKYLIGLLLAGFCQLGLATDFKEGVQYKAIEPAPPPGTGEVVQVMEFFMYGCPHCSQLEPYLEEWLKTKPENVEFVRVPAMFGGSANMHAGAFYALEIMGEGERLHGKLFDEIHIIKNRMQTRDALEEFLASQDVDMEKFRAAMSSFTVQTKAKRAEALMRRFEISGVPSVVVDARYRNDRLTGYSDYTELVDFLVAKVRKDRAGS